MNDILAFRPSYDGLRTVIVTLENVDMCRAALERGDCEGIALQSPQSAPESVEQVLSLSKSQILAAHFPLKRIDLLQHFKQLVGLFLNQPIGDLVVGQFKCLKYLSTDQRKGKPSISIESASLREARINGIKPGSAGEWAVKVGRVLGKLSLASSAINNLDGLIGDYSGLKHLSIIDCKNLRSLDKLKFFPELKILELDNVRKISGWSQIGYCKDLVTLKISGSGDLGNIDFLRNLPKITQFSFLSTDISSGDLSPILDTPSLTQVGFLNKKHFSHTLKDISAALEQRARR